MWAAIAGMLTALGTGIINAVTVWLAYAAAITVAIFSQWTTALYALLIMFIGYECYNFICTTLQEVLTYASNKLSAMSVPGGVPLTVQLANLSLYLAYHLQLPQCFSYMVNCIVLKWMLVKIPLIKW